MSEQAVEVQTAVPLLEIDSGHTALFWCSGWHDEPLQAGFDASGMVAFSEVEVFLLPGPGFWVFRGEILTRPPADEIDAEGYDRDGREWQDWTWLFNGEFEQATADHLREYGLIADAATAGGPDV